MGGKSIGQKVKKLLALAARAGTPDEAGSAAAMAERLMLEHKLTEVDLSDVADSLGTVSEEWLSGDIGKFTMMTWKQCLITGIARLNSCAALRYPDKRMKLIGRESDRRVVEYLACYLIREVERLALQDYERHGFNATVRRWTWIQNFGLGAVSVILARMKEEKQTVTNQNQAITALVLRDNDRLSSYMGQTSVSAHKTGPVIVCTI